MNVTAALRNALCVAHRVAAFAVAGGLLVPAMALGEVQIKILPDGSRVIYNEGPKRTRPVGGVRAPSPRLAQLIDRHARRTGLDPRLVHAVVKAESAFQVMARSKKGAMGLMQLMPETARDLGVRDPWDPDENVRGGTTYLRRMLDRYDGDVRLALAAYNAGPTAVDRYSGVPPYAETQAYISRIMKMLRSGGRLANRPARPRTQTAHRAAKPATSGAPVYLIRDANDQLVFTTQAPKAN